MIDLLAEIKINSYGDSFLIFFFFSFYPINNLPSFWEVNGSCVDFVDIWFETVCFVFVENKIVEDLLDDDEDIDDEEIKEWKEVLLDSDEKELDVIVGKVGSNTRSMSRKFY